MHPIKKEDEKVLEVYFDASCSPNPGPMGVGVILRDSKKIRGWYRSRVGYGVVKEGEIQAALIALRLAQKEIQSSERLVVKGDSQGAIRDLKSRQKKLRQGRITKNNEDYFYALCNATFDWIKREENLAHEQAVLGVEMENGKSIEGVGQPTIPQNQKGEYGKRLDR